MKSIALGFLVTLFAFRIAAAQTTIHSANELTAIYRNFAGHEPRLTADERLVQPIWKATLWTADSTQSVGYAAFRDNDLEENEVTWSEGFGEKANLMDALWTIQHALIPELVIYSDGEVLRPVGSLEQGRYEVSYVRRNRAMRLTLERPVN